MKIHFSNQGVVVSREKGDSKFYGNGSAAGEHRLFRHIQRALVAAGFDVIKKRAQQDGHLMGDEYQPYIRTRSPKQGQPHIMIYSGFYALRGANVDWNEGEVTLLLVGNCFDKGQDTLSLLRTMCKDKPNITCG